MTTVSVALAEIRAAANRIEGAVAGALPSQDQVPCPDCGDGTTGPTHYVSRTNGSGCRGGSVGGSRIARDGLLVAANEAIAALQEDCRTGGLQLEDARQEIGRLRHAQEATDVELRGPLLDVLLDGAPSDRPTQDLLHDLLEAFQTYRQHSIELNSVGWAAITALKLVEDGDNSYSGPDTSELVDQLIQSREAALTAADEFREQLAEQKKKSRPITVNVQATVNGAPASETVHRAVADALHQAARRGFV